MGMVAIPRYSPLELCRNKAGYEVVPAEKLRWDLAQAERELVAGGFETIANAGMLLVMRHAETDVSVFESGKLLFKTKEKARAERALDAALRALTAGDSPRSP